MTSRRGTWWALTLTAAVASGCGGDDGEKSGQGTRSTARPAPTRPALELDGTFVIALEPLVKVNAHRATDPQTMRTWRFRRTCPAGRDCAVAVTRQVGEEGPTVSLALRPQGGNARRPGYRGEGVYVAAGSCPDGSAQPGGVQYKQTIRLRIIDTTPGPSETAPRRASRIRGRLGIVGKPRENEPGCPLKISRETYVFTGVAR